MLVYVVTISLLRVNEQTVAFCYVVSIHDTGVMCPLCLFY